jgi:Fe-S cluster assembly protein SufD
VTEAIIADHSYLDAFGRHEKDLARVGSPALQRLRKAAIARFAELGFPGPRDEDWRFTPTAGLSGTAFELPPAGTPESPAGYRERKHGTDPGATLYCPNGHRPFLLDDGQPLSEGVVACSLAEALEKYPDLAERHLGRYADFKGHPFAALNTAFFRDGAFIYVPPGKVVEAPIYLDFTVAAFGSVPYVWHRRALIVVGEGAQATVVEEYNGLIAPYFTNAVTEVVLGPNAVVDHYKLQEEGPRAHHLGVMQVQLGRSANFSSHSIVQGAAWVRNEVNAAFDGEGGECTLNGLYQANDQQFVGNHTLIDHAQPHCASHELYKGILDGKARGVFNGKIYVRQDAQKTDAKQTNQTLLLSDDATINTKPQLEIYADDVKCTHGATVGQLDAEAVFYLRSRGIGREQARGLLTYAFANDIVRRIKVAPVRQRLEQAFLKAQRLPSAESDEERS